MLKTSKPNLVINQKIIQKLRDFLVAEEYDEIYKTLRWVQYHVDPWWDLKGFERMLWSLPRKKQMIFQLFYLGKKIPYSKVVYFIERYLIDELVKIRLLDIEKDLVKSNGFSIVPYRNSFFVVDLCYISPNALRRAPEAYLGADSYICANYHIIPSSKDTILDLCCGPGFQMILALGNARSCIGVEINPFAQKVCEFNLSLNQVQDRAKVMSGNLYAPIKDVKFSIIYANPPFIPVPSGIEYPIPGDGGEDGMNVLKKIYGSMDRHFLSEARSIVYCEALGNEENIFFFDWLRKVSQKNKWGIEVFVLGKVYYLEQIRRVAQLVLNTYDNLNKEILINKWLDYYQKTNPDAKYLYSLIIKTYKGCPRKKDFVINSFANPFTPEDKLFLGKDVKVKEAKNNYNIIRNNIIIVNTNEIGKFLIENSSKAIIDIARTYYKMNIDTIGVDEIDKKLTEGKVIDSFLATDYELLKLCIVSKR